MSHDDSDAVPRRLAGVWDGYVRTLQFGVAGLLVVVVAITLLNVTSRFLGLGSFTWTDETARRILVWMTFAGGALAVANGSHLRIDSLFADATGMVAKVVAWIVGGVSVVFFLLLVIGGMQFTLNTMERVTPGMRVSIAWTSAAAPVGGVLFLLSYIGHMVLGPPAPVRIEGTEPEVPDPQAAQPATIGGLDDTTPEEGH